MKKLILLAVIFLLPVLSKADYLTIGDTESNYFNWGPFTYAYCGTTAIIYTSAEMEDAKTLTAIAFDKQNQSSNNKWNDVWIYARHTSENKLTTIHNVDVDDYQLLYEGEFPDDESEGWIEVQLDTYFDYNGTDNVEIVYMNKYKNYSWPYPRYRHTIIPAADRQQRVWRWTFGTNDNPPTALNSTNAYKPNTRFEYFIPSVDGDLGGARYPKPFVGDNNPRDIPAITTGYYFTESRDAMDAKWKPNVEIADTNFETGLWRKIDAGPNVKGRDYWQSNPPEGMAFFRNPADGNYYSLGRDSVDKAFAGPIPLGISGGFYFNGIRYDSFFVSTNGFIALSNRRYYYDNEGNRTIPQGATNAYDPNSMDWFIIGDTEIGNPNTGVRGRDIVLDDMGNPIIGSSGTWVTKNGLNDPVPDNYGHRFMAVGMDPDTLFFDPNRVDSLKGRGLRNVPDITKTNSISSIMNPNRKGAIIAPFWGDLHLSQFNERLQTTDGHGKVYYKRSADGTKLTIAIYNIAPKGISWWWTGNRDDSKWDAMMNLRPGDEDYISADAQIILDSKDSSVTIVYTGFDGSLKSVPGAYDNLPDSISARDIFKFNTSAGVYGPARIKKDTNTLQELSTDHYSYPWSAEYVQFTEFYSNSKNPDFRLFREEDTLAVKFRQYKNTIRAANVHYLVRNPEVGTDMSTFSTKIGYSVANQYEMLAGEPRIGAIQPVGLIQNLTNDIQGTDGVNYTEQDFEFRARLRIINQVTGRTIYNHMVPVSDRCLSLDDADANQCIGDASIRVKLLDSVTNQGNGNYDVVPLTPAQYRAKNHTGIPPYGFAQVTFKPFEPNMFFDNNIGAQRVYLIAEPIMPGTGQIYADQWPFDDTLSANLFIIRRIEDFNDDVTEYHVDMGTGTAIPSALKWVNINAEVVSGEDVSKHPLAPRGEFAALNDPDYKLTSPVIRMNRLTLDGKEAPGKYADVRGFNGDEIRSYPIDMRGKHGAILSLAVQRTEYRENWRRDYMDNTLVGPEPRTIHTTVNDNTAFTVFAESNAVSEFPDELVVQFAKPSEDGITGLVNNVEWSYHPRPEGQAPITDNPALTVYGAGGHMVGYDEVDYNRPLPLPERPDYHGLRPDRYDDGIDFEFKKFFIQIPDTFINWPNDAAQNFRFRIKVLATNDSRNITILDDADDFFVDNIRIMLPSEVTDIEVSAVKIDWPYTLIPASQATSVPVSVSISNNTAKDAPVFSVKVRIHRIEKDEDGNVTNIEDEPIYCRMQNIGNLNGGNSLNISMPNWDVRKSQLDTTAWYRLYAISMYPNGDLIPNNDTTYTDVKIVFGEEFAYDYEPENPVNDVPDEMNLFGRGLNMSATSYAEAIGGRPFTVEDRAGSQVGTGSGQIGVKFNILNSDTLRGVKAFFGSLNAYPDFTRIRIYSNEVVNARFSTVDSLDRPDTIIAEVLRQRAVNDGENVIRLDQFVTYLFDEPVILQRGTYWVTIEQQSGKRGLQLGASASRSAMRVTKFYDANDFDGTTVDTFGIKGLNLLIDKSFRKMSVDGRLLNDNYFAYENYTASGNWVPFTPSMGNPAYPHFGHFGFFNGTSTLSGGTWIPLVRPYFGFKSHGKYADEYQWCPDDIPVEVIAFEGEVRKTGIDLFWETGSETNNYGFYLERRPYDEYEEAAWDEISFVSGAGNSTVINRYNYLDKDVVAGQTYQYRVKQIDFDGTESCATSNIVTLTYNYFANAELLPNSPNPFSDDTYIRFVLPNSQKVKLDVLDMFGNVIATLLNGNAPAGENNIEWNAKDSNGYNLSNGTYIYRLTTDNNVLIGKMTLVR